MTELPLISPSAAPVVTTSRDASWYRAAKRARQLSWASLAWMSIEGIVGLIAGFEANSLSLIVWASSSFVEGLASVTIIWRFTGARLHSATSERTAQRVVAGSFLLLVPYFLYESFERLLHGSDVESSALGIAVTGSAIVLMPLLGWAKLRLATRLDSSATAGGGDQKLPCAVPGAAAPVAPLGGGAGGFFLDPLAAFAVSGIAGKECLHLW